MVAPSDAALTDALVAVAASLLKKFPANARQTQRLTEEVGALLAGVRAAEPAWGVRQTQVQRVLGEVMKRLEDARRSAGSVAVVEGDGGAEQSAARGTSGAGKPEESGAVAARGADAASDEAEKNAKALKQAAARAKAKQRKAAEASATSAVAAAVAAATSHASSAHLSASCADLADWVVVDAMECC